MTCLMIYFFKHVQACREGGVGEQMHRGPEVFRGPGWVRLGLWLDGDQSKALLADTG